MKGTKKAKKCHSKGTSRSGSGSVRDKGRRESQKPNRTRKDERGENDDGEETGMDHDKCTSGGSSSKVGGKEKGKGPKPNHSDKEGEGEEGDEEEVDVGGGKGRGSNVSASDKGKGKYSKI
jgi:hypothetical protein